MANMSYCKFENTYHDLLDCRESINKKLSTSEDKFRKRLVELCEEIVNEFDENNIESDEDE